jgi:hypothetical protein
MIKEYKKPLDNQKRALIECRLDEIFTRRTCFESLNMALKKIYAK